MAIYVTPVVAIVLGVVFRDETVASLALVGMVLVLAGAWLTSRAEAPTGTSKPGRVRPTEERAPCCLPPSASPWPCS